VQGPLRSQEQRGVWHLAGTRELHKIAFLQIRVGHQTLENIPK